MSDATSAILKEFLIESFDNLSNISDELTQYEKNSSDKELLNSIFRKVHTLKGSASFLGLEKLQSITHDAENILDLIREDSLLINPKLIDLFLETFDSCIELLKAIESTGKENDKNYSSLTNKLASVLSGDSKFVESEYIKQGEKIHPKLVQEDKQQILEMASEEEIEVKTAPRIAEKSKSEANVPEAKKKEEPKKAASSGSQKNSNMSLSDSVVRVNVQLLDKIMNVVGELVLNRNQILQYANSNELPDLNRLAQQLNVITTELQTDIMTTRMQPVGSVLSKFERVVRDLSRSQNKKINLEITGKDTELDKTLLEAIKDPMTHLIRNSIDHGIELPEVRATNGKDEEGLIQIKAYHEGGQVTIDIKDDGNGIDPQKILDKALSKGIISQDEASKMSEKQVLGLIFRPGFSTAEKVTNISGRGVGMDVVRSNIEKIGGSVDIMSEVGQGTLFKLKIPLTLAIVPALVVGCGNETFAIPQINLVELVRIDAEDEVEIEKLHDSEFFRLRGDLIPIFRLKDTLSLSSITDACIENVDGSKSDEGLYDSDSVNIVILNAEGFVYGLVVDKVLDTEEIVVKPLSRKLKGLSTYAGATIMGDGRVSLIIDALGYFNTVNKDAGQKAEHDEREDTSAHVENYETQEILLCELGDGRTYGVPLCLVNRLEEFQAKNIEWSGEQPLVRYGNKAMPLINLERTLKLNGKSSLDELKDSNDQDLACVVVKSVQTNYGLVVKRIRDIAISTSQVDSETVDRKGILGSLFIDDHTITLIDTHTVLELQDIGTKKVKLDERKLSGRILLVEDSPLYRKIEADFLNEKGLEVVIAKDGKEALEILGRDSNFDIIITDIEMPRMNGWEFREKLKESHGKLADIPVIALTTRVSKKDIEKGKKAGFSGHIEKFDKEEVFTTVSTLLAG